MQRLLRRASHVLAEEGATKTLVKSLDKVKDLAVYPFLKRYYSKRTFSSAGKEYSYFIHHYNPTWRNERAVEIALVKEFLQRVPEPSRLLEVGNGLNYYLDVPHVVVDKYEPTPGIINQDILEFGTPGSFDAIVSISTLEHVGWDETPRDPGKVRAALDHMRKLLAPGGRFFLSFPIGYNTALDQLVFNNELGFRDTRYLKRISADNRWAEVALEDTVSIAYNRPFPAANALFVGID